MIDDFIIRAALAGIGMTLATGPLGSCVVWRRMAYFGDAISHAAILGVALALASDLPIVFGTLLVALSMAVAVAGLAGRGWTMDTTLGVLAHSALAFGLVAVSFIPQVRVDLSSWLFGDILLVSWRDVVTVWLGASGVLGLLAWRWQRMLLATLSEDLAHASGISPRFERLVLVLALAALIAVAIKLIGALLIAALLIIPAAAARSMARSPEAMALIAALIGAVAVLGGIAASLHYDIPTGPAIIVTAALIFALTVRFKP